MRSASPASRGKHLGRGHRHRQHQLLRGPSRRTARSAARTVAPVAMPSSTTIAVRPATGGARAIAEVERGGGARSLRAAAPAAGRATPGRCRSCARRRHSAPAPAARRRPARRPPAPRDLVHRSCGPGPDRVGRPARARPRGPPATPPRGSARTQGRPDRARRADRQAADRRPNDPANCMRHPVCCSERPISAIACYICRRPWRVGVQPLRARPTSCRNRHTRGAALVQGDLDGIRLLAPLSPAHRSALAARCAWRRFRPGEVVLSREADDRRRAVPGLRQGAGRQLRRVRPRDRLCGDRSRARMSASWRPWTEGRDPPRWRRSTRA